MARIIAACVLSLAALGGIGWVFACQNNRIVSHEEDIPASAPAVAVRTSEIVVPVTTPQLAMGGPASPAPRLTSASRSGRPAARRAASVVPPDSLPRRVARFITGDGTHQVRPFPTVPEK